MRDLKEEQKELQKRYRQHIRRIKDQYRLYDKHLALMFGYNVDQANLVEKMRNGHATIHTCDMITLSHNLILDYEDASILQELVPDGYMAYTIKADATNGCFKDEMLQIGKYSGLIIEEEEKERPDSEKIIQWAKQIASQAATVKQEVS